MITTKSNKHWLEEYGKNMEKFLIRSYGGTFPDELLNQARRAEAFDKKWLDGSDVTQNQRSVLDAYLKALKLKLLHVRLHFACYKIHTA